MADDKKLPEEVAKKYEVLKGHGVGEYHFKGRVIRLHNLTVDAVAALVKKGFPYLVEKKPAPPAKT